MINIVPTKDRIAACSSCGESKREKVYDLVIGRNEYQSMVISLCLDCINKGGEQVAIIMAGGEEC